MPDSIQEQTIKIRREHILGVAARIFAQKGFHAATIKDIAREAGIADGTIYNYFENKTALLLGIFEQMRQSLAQQPLEAFTTHDMRSFLKHYLQQPLMALRGDNFELFRVVMSEILVNQELSALYRQNILEPTLALAEQQFRIWADQGLIKSARLALSIRAISGLIIGLMVEHVLGDQALAVQWDALPDHLTDLVLNGLGVNQP
ncbi:MAG: TetR/AcrR family transcriptional regulator [Anaerolinea sp.]|nr:TetR/AcrR family transcriptional regulator [Anaerolinea sp.]